MMGPFRSLSGPNQPHWFYEQATQTPVQVYADAACTIPHPIPVITDSEGNFPMIFTEGQAPVFASTQKP